MAAPAWAANSPANWPPGATSRCATSSETMDETIDLAADDADAAGRDVRLTAFVADVSDADAMNAFAEHVASEFDTDRVHLLFNNAGISGASSIVTADHTDWDRVFGVTFGGVLNGMRSFMPMLMQADRGHVINTSSVNGLWACLGPSGAHSAYSAAKFAVRGLTESLVVDFRMNAPHLTASVVMPGHIGTQIALNSMIAAGLDPKNLSEESLQRVRQSIEESGIDASGASDEDIRNLLQLRADSFESSAPMTAAEAATIILDGVTSGAWRVLVGDDAVALDEMLRATPTEVYTDAFMQQFQASGHFGGLIDN
ncbi:MAG: SDR family oxidoreductase [Ilumatobacteraceae bacterium]